MPFPVRAARTRALCLMLAPALQAESAPAVHRADYDHILGTSLHLELQAPAERARSAEDAALAEIERLRRVLSTYDDGSELARWRAAKRKIEISGDLAAVLAACDDWSRRSGGAFDPSVAVFTELWQTAAKRGTPPDDAELAAARARAHRPLWTLDAANRSAEFTGDAPITVDALAKGYVVERAADAARKAGAEAVLIQIGGDLRAVGPRAFRVAIADPKSPQDNATPLCTVDVRDAALATSGAYARGFDVAGKHYSHIIDPASGRPAARALQASVIAPDATTADALATILMVLPTDEGLKLIDATRGAACLVVEAGGARRESREWSRWLAAGAESKPAAASAWPGGGELLVTFEIAQPAAPAGGGRRGGYKRPYVAAWIEAPDGSAVRTLCLWTQKPKWIDDLQRWSKLYRGRRGDVQAVSKATRPPGKYDLSWDGRDDAGAAVPFGKYIFHLEAAREHGTYQILTRELAIDGKAFELALEDGNELKNSKVSFRAGGAAK